MTAKSETIKSLGEEDRPLGEVLSKRKLVREHARVEETGTPRHGVSKRWRKPEAGWHRHGMWFQQILLGQDLYGYQQRAQNLS